MATIALRENRRVIDYAARDYESFRKAMVDLIPQKLPEWTDRSEADFGIALLELVAYAGDILSYYLDRQTNECFAATAQERRSIIQHLRLIGYEMGPAAPASARLSLIVGKNLTGTVEIRRGDQFSTVSGRDQRSMTYEYVGEKPLVIQLGPNLPLSVDQPNFREAIDVIPVREGKTILSEVVGVSDGSPNQTFALARPRVLKDSIELTVETDPPSSPWRLRKALVLGTRALNSEQLAALEYQDRIASTLGFSRAPDRDFSTETDENDVTRIRFGDGQYGMIPPVGGRILATYRVGGGSAGNVGAGQITVIAQAPQLQLLGIRVTNRRPASGGAERESVEQALRYAPIVFSSMSRAVTADDFVAQARLFPGVSKARAVASNWNTVILYIAPTGSGEEPSDILARDLLAYFEDKRMLTVQLSIAGPDYREIEIDVEVGALPYFRIADVEAQAIATIRNLYAFERADFSQSLYVSKLYEALEALPSVEFANVKRFRLRQEHDAAVVNPLPDNGTIVLRENELAILAPNFNVSVVGGVSRGSP